MAAAVLQLSMIWGLGVPCVFSPLLSPFSPCFPYGWHALQSCYFAGSSPGGFILPQVDPQKDAVLVVMDLFFYQLWLAKIFMIDRP